MWNSALSVTRKGKAIYSSGGQITGRARISGAVRVDTGRHLGVRLDFYTCVKNAYTNGNNQKFECNDNVLRL